MKCSSCRVNVYSKKNFVKFRCPNCFESYIVRCGTCKTLSVKYVCEKCNFKGP